MTSDLRRSADWQRLRRDRRSAAAVLCVVASVVLAVLACLAMVLPDQRSADRASIGYWLIIVPVAWWGAELAGYTPWAVRLLQPAAFGASLTGLAVLALSLQRPGASGLMFGAAIGSLVLSAAGVLLFRSSMLRVIVTTSA